MTTPEVYKEFCVFDMTLAVFDWLKATAEDSEHWTYQTSYYETIPARIMLFNEQLITLFVMRWGDEFVTRRYAGGGWSNGYR